MNWKITGQWVIYNESLTNRHPILHSLAPVFGIEITVTTHSFNLKPLFFSRNHGKILVFKYRTWSKYMENMEQFVHIEFLCPILAPLTKKYHVLPCFWTCTTKCHINTMVYISQRTMETQSDTIIVPWTAPYFSKLHIWRFGSAIFGPCCFIWPTLTKKNRLVDMKAYLVLLCTKGLSS